MKRKSLLQELRGSSLDELKNRQTRLEGELFKLRIKHVTNQLENPMQIRSARREIARVLTVIRQAKSK